MFFPTTTIKVERKVKVGTETDGSPIMNFITIYDSVPADLQANESEFIIEPAGQTAMSHKRVFCDRINIVENDVLTDYYDGVKHKVVSVNSHGILSHLELDCISGV